MNTKLFILSLSVALMASSPQANAQTNSPVDYVNPLVGSQSSYELSTGNTYPAIAMPWGMNFWTPQTGKMGDGWQYVYTQHRMRGLKQTHQPSPWINDYGQFSLFAETGEPQMNEEKRASWYSHKAETATPYYYKVYLADYDVVAELAPTEHAAIMRFTFPDAKQSHILVDAFDKGSYIKVMPGEKRIIGYTTRNSGGVPANFKNYFVVELSKPFTAKVYDGDKATGATELQADHAGAIASFQTHRGEEVIVRVASSFISPEQALENLKEVSGRDFEAVKQAGRQRWNDVLGRIEVKDDSNTDHLRTFYSCLYRSLLFPRSLAEKNAQGETVHYSPYNGKVLPGYMYTDTGFWDTFRSLFPLLNLVYPDEAVKMQEGLVNAYKESGFLPEWASPGHRDCMVGNNSASIVADAYLSGLRGYDAETLWQAVVHDANAVHPEVSSTGRCGFEYYNKLGYVPYDVKINENVARTLEYAFDDWSIYRFGQALGKSKKELKPFLQRSMNYKNVFDPATKMMRGRNKDGKFQSPFSPYKWGDAFTEGNSWHWTWCVFHDPEGLIQLMGGQEGFVSKLDSVFFVPPIFDDSYYGFPIHEIREMQIVNMGNYAHGNQPIQHAVYLYDYALQPWKAQHWIRQVMDRLYTPNPDGYCGDEDNGQTSAWYVFSAMGFYPVCPGSQQYAIGAPYFKNVTIHLPSGKDVVIDASSHEPYVDAMTINGTPWAHNYILQRDLQNGCRIAFTMTAQPNKTRGTMEADKPFSLSKVKR